MTSPDASDRPTYSPQAKICGITTRAALDAAIVHGADYIGLVFHPRSPRNLTLADAAALAVHTRTAGNGVRSVALLVDPDDAALDAVVATVAPDVLQLHGHETPQRVRAVRARYGLPIIKAAGVRTEADVAAAAVHHDPGIAADLVLFDAKPPAEADALPGGNGLAFDWRILAGIDGRMPFALAGGLTPENVATALSLTGATLADVSSGVESAPGVKDAELIRRFLSAVKRTRFEPLTSSAPV